VNSGKKTADLIELPFAVVGRVGPMNHVLDGVPIPMVRGKFLWEMVRCYITYRENVMWPVLNLLWNLLFIYAAAL